MHDTHAFLETLAVVLCAAAVTTFLFQRLRQPVVLGYLLSGMVIGPYIPIPIQADGHVVETLSELGVVLLMFSLGIDFNLQKLMRVGPTAAFVAIVQCSLMIWLGYLAGQAFGWSRLASVYAGAVIAISSTTIIVKAFEEQRVSGDFTHIVFGVLIVEDLIAILLITILTALSAGESLGAVKVGVTAGKLAAFLCSMMVGGVLIIPRAIRKIVALDRAETTVVASVGIAFGFAYLAAAFGYSVALGAFIAGSLVAESGVEHVVERAVQPVRDIFAAIFFVSVGMLINPVDIAKHWSAVLVFLILVVLGKVSVVTLSAFLTGQTVRTSVKTGMSLSQIGEFSFIIAAVGVSLGATDQLLYSIAVAVSAITTLLTPWLIRAAEPAAAFVDRKLPRSLQTFVALYGSWVEQLVATTTSAQVMRVRRLVRWLIVDAIVVAAIVIGVSMRMPSILAWAPDKLGLSAGACRVVLLGLTFVVSSPFWIGMIRVARFLGFELANHAFPAQGRERVDLAAAPRRLLIVTLQMAIVIAVGTPLLAITQPFLPPFRSAAVLILLLVVLAYSFWRSATNLAGHTRAAAQAIAETLARRTREERTSSGPRASDEMGELLRSLGSPAPVILADGSPMVGKTLAETRLRGLTGATILAIQRGEDTLLVPAGDQRLLAGDVLAVAGSHDVVEAATRLLRGEAIMNV